MKRAIYFSRFLTVLISFAIMSLNLTAQSLQQDSLALVALYDGTDGVNWMVNTNWLTGQPLSTWYGLKVYDNRVVQINLTNNNLAGSIPYEIENLTNLEVLDLGNNQLTGSIPAGIYNLSSLSELSLYFNELTDTIPTTISNLSNLEVLKIYNNNLHGKIPSEIGSLVNLKELGLGMDDLSGTMPSSIGSLTNLEILAIWNCNVSGEIPSEIWNLTNLRFIYLQQNQLEGTIPEQVGNLVNLHTLSLFNNQFSGPIPERIGNLTNLQLLDVGSNQLTGPLPPEIGNLTNLQVAYFQNNQFIGEIPSTIGKLNQTTELYFNQNMFTGSIPPEIINLDLMHRLYIYNNQLTDLPDLSSLSTLSDLQIHNNQFSFEDIEPNIGITTFVYSPQDSVGMTRDTTLELGDSLIISVSVGGTANKYQWMKDGVDIPEADNNSYTVSPVDSSDAGSYLCRITNTIATKLELYSRPITVTVEGVVGVTERTTQIQKTYALYQNYPNPFNPTTMIRYDLPKASLVVLKIYNLFGQEIRTLVDEFQSEGEKTLLWDGFNTKGQKVSSGIYVCQIKADSFSKSNKMIVIK